MPDSKITALTSIGTSTDPANDPLVLVDVSDTSMAASGTTKKVTLNQLLGASGTATLASATITGALTVGNGTSATQTFSGVTNILDIGYGSLRGGSAYGDVRLWTDRFRIYNNAGTQIIKNISGTNGDETWYDGAGGTRMTLNSTGLGVGLTPSYKLDVSGDLAVNGNENYVYLFSNYSIGNNARVRFRAVGAGGGSGYGGDFRISTRATNNNWNTDVLTIDSSANCIWTDGAGGTRMTLNSTGLGVGGSPQSKISCAGNSSSNQVADITIVRSSSGTAIQTGPNIVFADGTTNNTIAVQNTQGRFGIWNYGAGAWNERLSIDSSGNVGVGVTPSAWGAGLKALQVGARGYGAYFDFNNDVVALSSNLFWTGSNYGRISASSKYAVAYFQDIGTGAHQWLSSSAAGTNGVAPTMNTNMVLDATGNLLVGKTAVNDFSIGFQTTQTGSVVSTLAASTNGTGSTMSVYSTGASAYRFYVGMGGTVFATNTTISAISDARLKENVQDIDVGLGAILALKPRKFDWKDGKGKDIKGDRGFIAQEFEQVFPQLVDEWKDNTPEGEAPYKSVRQDLIPVLVKAIQELTARVQTLEAR